MREILEPDDRTPQEWAAWDDEYYEPLIRTVKFADVLYPNIEHVLLYELDTPFVEQEYDEGYYDETHFRPLTVLNLHDVDGTIKEFERAIASSETDGPAFPFLADLDATGGREKVRPRGSGPLSYADRKRRSQAFTRLRDLEARKKDLKRILEKLKTIQQEEDGAD